MNCFNKFIKVRARRGALLPIVLIMVLLLMLMVTPLLRMSAQQLNVAKSQENINYAYISSGSITEKVMKEIKNYISVPGSFSVITYLDDNQFSNDVVTEIKNYIIPTFNNSSESKIVVIDLSTSEAKAQVKSIERVRYAPNATNDKISITVGIITSSGFTRNKKSVSGTEIYSELTFEVDKPTNNFKPAAVNGIGDLFVTGGMKSIINGDVKLVGTAPAKTKQPEQYYYGGIYAKSGGQLDINGSAFVRAFIRCGDVSDNPNDNSFINITKNAVAQGIQIFGSNDRILVQNDAFTFDDLEMNGLNSIIAINRNYFGLSKGDGADEGENHDASSAIVNSAIVHHPDEASIENAQRSKIIINGDVFINGGTFWIDPKTGGLLHGTDEAQIEDASTAWNEKDEIPTYKNYEPNTGDSYYYHRTLDQTKISWINEQYSLGNAKGFGNLFQMWSVQPNPLSWFTNDAMPSRKKYNEFTPSALSKISGLCSYEMAANGKLYSFVNSMMTSGSEVQAENDSAISRATNVLSSKQNFIDSLYYLDEAISKPFKDPTYTTDPLLNKEWGTKWGDILSKQWDDYIDDTIDYLKVIKEPLKTITEDFIKREYKFGTVQKIENSLQPSIDPLQNKFEYIGTELEKCNAYDNTLVLTDIEMGGSLVNGATGNYDIGKFANNLAKYYIIVNKNPDKTIEINREINGIVYTKGKVVMRDHGKLNGFIIAAGKGCDPSNGYVDGSAADPDRMPQIIQFNSDPDADDSTTNLSKLDDGSYASIVFEGTTGQSEINFKLGPTTNPTPEESLNFLLSQYSGSIKNILDRLF